MMKIHFDAIRKKQIVIAGESRIDQINEFRTIHQLSLCCHVMSNYKKSNLNIII